jgi:predicted permease
VSGLRALWSRVAALFDRERAERELDEELAAHVEMHTADNVRAGMSPAEARRVALARLGGIEQTKELYRDRRRLPVLEKAAQDARLAFRMMGRARGFTATALLVLALGIGANTVMFSVVNSVLLRPLPYPAPDRLQLIQMLDRSGDVFAAAPPDFYAYRSRTQSFESVAAFHSRALDLTGSEEPERIRALIVSADFLRVLGVAPALGRAFEPAEEQWGSHRVALLTDEFWRRRYAADPGIVGRPIVLAAEPYVVVGVLPPRFSFVGMEAQALIPMSFAPGDNMNTRNNYFLTVLARLREGVGAEGAAADVDRVTRQLALEHAENRGRGARIRPLHDVVVEPARRALIVLFGAVVFVLLIACADLANLLMARAAARRREIALRIAIGASRRRVVGQLLTESVVLSACGTVLALGLAWASLGVLNSLGQDVLPRTEAIRIDAVVLAYTALVAVVTAVLFGLAPAWRSADVDPGETLQEGGRGGSDARGHRVRSALVALEIAMSLVLLVGAGLMVKSMHGLTRVEAGFQPDSVLTVQVGIPRLRYVDQALERQFSPLAYARASAFFGDVLDRVRAVPGVTAAGAVNGLPLMGDVWGKTATLYDRPLPATMGELPGIQYRVVAGDYFRALRVPILAGRPLTDADGEDAPKVAVISREMARRHWGDANPVGKVLSVNPPRALVPAGSLPADYEPRRFTIVGVAGDVRYASLGAAPSAVVYVPYAQGAEGQTMMYLTVRTEGDPLLVAAAVRERVRAVDPDVPATVRTMEDRVSASLAQPRLHTAVLGAFALLALVLASVGVYGVMAYSTRLRTREIGIRMAIGAESRAILALLLGNGLGMVGAGVAAGLLGAFAVTRALQSLLFEVSPSDPLVFAEVTVGLSAVAMLAAWVPARRASPLEPLVALRAD